MCVICLAILLEEEAALYDQPQAVVLSEKMWMVGYVCDANPGFCWRVRCAIAYVMRIERYSNKLICVSGSPSISLRLVSRCGQWMCHMNPSSAEKPPAPNLQLSQ